jgi:hypothetical protein
MPVSDTKYVARYTTRKNRRIRVWVVYAVDVLNSETRRGDLIGLEITRSFHLGHYSATVIFISEGE